jgi:peptidoglycan/xylan/chitin deacetylase (PgdA/CDA1 family)
MTRSGRIAVLTYHSLDESGSVLSTPPGVFADQMRILHELAVKVVPLAEVPRLLDGPGPPGPVVALTFDDGFRSVYEHGWEILQRHRFPATVFLVTDYCGKTNTWPGQPAHVQPSPLRGWSEVQEMSAAGITFGCHTRTHPDLRKIAPYEAKEEWVSSRKAIEDVTSSPADSFAYPYGFYNDPIKRLAQEHFSVACSSWLGFASGGSDRFALERLDAYYLQSVPLFRRLFSREMRAYILLRRALRDLRARVRDRV